MQKETPATSLLCCLLSLMAPNWFAFIRLFYIWDLKTWFSENNEGECAFRLPTRGATALPWEKMGVATVLGLMSVMIGWIDVPDGTHHSLLFLFGSLRRKEEPTLRNWLRISVLVGVSWTTQCTCSDLTVSEKVQDSFREGSNAEKTGLYSEGGGRGRTLGSFVVTGHW